MSPARGVGHPSLGAPNEQTLVHQTTQERQRLGPDCLSASGETQAALAAAGRYLSSLWLGLVTPTAFEVGKHLIEGLRNSTIVRDQTALEVFPIRPIGIREAVKRTITGA